MIDVDNEAIARVCHEANRAWQLVTGDPAPSPPWDEASEGQRDSALEGVAQALAGATPEELHESWCTSKRDAGWRYGGVKDEELLTHPCLVPYAELPEDQRRKDALFHGIVNALTAHAPTVERLRLAAGDVLLWRINNHREWGARAAASASRVAGEIGQWVGGQVYVVALAGPDEIEVLDPERMRAAGWIRAPGAGP